MKRSLISLFMSCIVGSLIYAQSYDPRVERAMRAQKKAMEAQILANKAERAKALSAGKKVKSIGPILTDSEKAKKNQANLDRIRKRMQFLQNNASTLNPEAKYRAGPGGAAIREGAPGYKTPSNNLEKKEARVAQTYPKRY